MSAEVKEPTYRDIDVNDPRIRSAVQNMQKHGYDKHAMVEIIGVPVEVVEQHLRALKP